jgi:hypothetical protein
MKRVVYFFGGYNATQIQVDAWVKSAQVLEPTVDFVGFPWPSYGHGGTTSAIDKIKKTDPYKDMVAAIVASKADMYYIVGHSSGCGIANDADANLKNNSKITLVSLDGFKPSDAQLPHSSVWAAEGGGQKSFNHPGPGYKGLHVFPASVHSYWALHFSLVNTATTDNPATDISTGYANCKANLCWL